MTSILRKLRTGRRKTRPKPATTSSSTPSYHYDGQISAKTTDESGGSASEFDSGRPPRKPQQLTIDTSRDDDDKTHPMQEQSPPYRITTTTSSGSNSSKRHLNFPSFALRKSDAKMKGGSSTPKNSKRRIRKQTTEGTGDGDDGDRLDSSGIRSPGGDEQAINREAERIARAAAALDSRGNELFEMGYFDKAMEAYSKALKLKRRTFHSMLEEADEVFEQQGGDSTAEGGGGNGGDGDGDVDFAKSDPKLLVSMATSINNIGYLRQRAGDATPDETMAAYKKSLRIKRKILGNDSLSVGKTLNNVGSVHYLKKDFKGAIPAYEEALQIMQANLGDGHPDVATVMSNMGDVYLAMGEPVNGIKRYRMALNIRWAAFGERDPRVVRLLEKIAKIEVGDKMPTPQAAAKDKKGRTVEWDETSELFDLDTRPLTEELHTLHEEVEDDMQYVDMLQKRMAVDMVKDKVVILKGMRELWGDHHDDVSATLDGSQRSSSNHEDEDSVPVVPVPASPGANGMPIGIQLNRNQAQQHVKERLARLRARKSASGQLSQPNGNESADIISESGHDSSSTINSSSQQSKSNMHHGGAASDSGRGGTPFTVNGTKKPQQQKQHGNANMANSWSVSSRNNIYGASFYSPNNPHHHHAKRKNLSTMKPNEIKDEVKNIRSALQLKSGINTLRSMDAEDASLTSAFSWSSKKSQLSKISQSTRKSYEC